MEIKLGQYFRTKRGEIRHYIKGTTPHQVKGELYYLTHNDYNKVVGVSDDPRKLVNPGDLVLFSKCVGSLEYMHNLIVASKEEVYVTESKDFIKPENIIKIYTPDCNSGFALAWEVGI